MDNETNKPTGIGPKFLDWGIWSGTPPSYKNLSDNLRAYLTIGAYVVLFNYLWHWGNDRIPGWVFQGAALLWGLWVLWFAILTVIQTWNLYIGFCLELMGVFLTPWAKKRGHAGEFTDTEHVVLTILFLPFAWSATAMIGTVFYIIGAMLRGAHLM